MTESTDLEKLESLRDGLEWFEQYACSDGRPWKGYRVQVASTRQLAESMIDRIHRTGGR